MRVKIGYAYHVANRLRQVNEECLIFCTITQRTSLLNAVQKLNLLNIANADTGDGSSGLPFQTAQPLACSES